MISFIETFAAMGESVFQLFWFPIAVWTVLAILTFGILKAVSQIHPQYHYQIRVALVLALPIGILASWLMDALSGFIISPEASSATLKFVAVMAPMDIIPVQEAQSMSATTLLYAGAILMLIIGSVFLFLKYTLQWIQLFFIKRESITSLISAVGLVDKQNQQLAKSTGKEIVIAFSKEDIVPVTFGVIKPIILLPASLKRDNCGINLAIRHELTHIKENDFFTHLFITGIHTTFWFHPLIHTLTNQITEYREIRCDSFVLADRSISRKDYASLLLELLPMPTINKQMSIHMAQETSNLKKRIQMISTQKPQLNLPKRAGTATLGLLLMSVVLAMSCTDMQTHSIIDDEELNLMTATVEDGGENFHEIYIYMKSEDQPDRYSGELNQLETLKPEHIKSIAVYKGTDAIERFGDRGKNGVIVVRTKLDTESFNRARRALGLEVSAPPPPSRPSNPDENVFVVVEQEPELIGGLQGIQKDIRYPETARRAGIEGRVIVQFIVTKEGGVRDAQIVRSIGGGTDEEALRAVQNAKFKPGLQRGRAVDVQYSLPVVFRLMGDNNENGN